MGLAKRGSKAKEKFEKLGYKRVANTDDHIIFSKSIDRGTDHKEVIFYDQLKSFSVGLESELNTPSIQMDLFKAITVQLEELGWLNDLVE